MNLEKTDAEIEQIIKKGVNTSTVDLLNDFAWNNRRSELNKSYKAANIAEELAEQLNYPKGLGQALKTQGYCLWRFSDYQTSMEKSSRALEISQQLNDKKEEADVLNSIGAVYMFLKDNENRLRCNLQCLELRKEIGDLEGITGSLNNTGETYMEMGEFSEAEMYFHRCLNYPGASDQIKGWSYHNLGILESKRKNYKQARAHFKTSIEHSRRAKDQTLTCETLYFKGLNSMDLHDPDAAHQILQEALKLAKSIGAKDEQQKIHHAISKLYEEQGNIVKAFTHFNLYSEIYNQVYNERNAGNIYNLKSKYEVNAARREAEIERLKNVELKRAFEEIETQKDIIERKNQSIRDSIRYAQRIQSALLTYDDQWESISPNYFALLLPRDIVSGDFYWASTAVDEYAIWAVADCTGHGVPGALMSMLGVGLLNEIIVESNITETNKILDLLRKKIIKALEQKGGGLQRQDGMDIALCSLNKKTRELQFSGAYNSLYLVSKRKLEHENLNRIRQNGYFLYEIKPDKQPVGASVTTRGPFSQFRIKLESGDRLYSTTDGFVDQFGGEQKKKFMRKNFMNTLLEIQSDGMEAQKGILQGIFENWMRLGNCKQIDDVCVVGIEII